MKAELVRRLAAEAIGTMFLLAAVVGSGIMAEHLAGGNQAVALLANTFATSAMLVVLILSFGPLSAHFNPAVSLVMALRKELPWRDLPAYVLAQFIGAFAGVLLAHTMFEMPLWTLSLHDRSGSAKMISEGMATFGLVGVILSCSAHRKSAIPYAVAAYIGAAYWFTASTSFANPAVTVARAFTDTFSGIRLMDAPGFILAQIVGAVSAAGITLICFHMKRIRLETLFKKRISISGNSRQPDRQSTCNGYKHILTMRGKIPSDFIRLHQWYGVKLLIIAD